MIFDFIEKLKATSSTLNNMSATVENPSIPLVQRNGQPNYTPVAQAEDDVEKGPAFKKRGKKKWSKYVCLFVLTLTCSVDNS